MKRFIISIALSLVPFVCVAGGDSLKVAVSGTIAGTTNVVTTSHKFSGYLESVSIDVGSGATNTIVVSTATDTLLTLTSATADATYYPRYAVNNNAGAAIGVATNDLIKHLLVQEPIVITVTSTQTNSVDLGVLIKTYNVK